MCSRERDAVRVRDLSFDYRKGPSFSSTLLEHIYKSMDGNDGDVDGEQDHRGTRKQQDKDFVDDAGYRVKLLDKWMLERKNKNVDVQNTYKKPTAVDAAATIKKNAEPLIDKKLHYIDNDPLFFSSGSNSSDTNSSLFSDHDPIPLPTTKTRSSCFLPPKPIRTREKNINKSTVNAKTEHHHYKYETEQDDDVPASTKSRALKFYSHLKKMKQPISPGVKLTTFINSILSKSNTKKQSNRGSAAVNPTCSSASSFTRTSKTTTTPSSIRTNYSVKPPSVKLVPVNVKIKTVDVNPPEPHLLTVKQNHSKVNRALNSTTTGKISGGRVSEDARSDCSDDLFELDHLKLRSINENVGDLPVFETTRISSSSSRNYKNRVQVLKNLESQ